MCIRSLRPDARGLFDTPPGFPAFPIP
jgi:hypothetical protein